MTHDQAIQALKIFGLGSIVGALIGGRAGFVVGAAFSGAVAVEMIEPGQGAAALWKMLGVEPPAPEDQTVHYAIPVFDDEQSPVRKMLLLGDGAIPQ
jgi:hypothetical protein